MFKKALVYSAGLIALYLVVENYTGFTKDAGAVSSGGVSVIKAFQARN